ncbi:MAG: hypothetical protein NC489_28855 [Ruminococcus flavefaciens]|nr:hypothetical protein [Ruminococcus flavefaciens]
MENYKAERERMERGAVTAGLIHGNVSNAATVYGEEKFHASRGHGFAAERAGTLYDRLAGHDAQIVGDNNAKNGADRIVDGIHIQSKYCASGGKCIRECFADGKFRYMNSDGTPMQIEVPFDKYDSAVQAMQERIRRGEVPNITNPEEAKNIVRQGKFTYEQVRNIARAGTVESIAYDAVNGTVIATGTFGITTILSFAVSVWNGEDMEIALQNAVAEGLKVSGVTLITAIFAGQLTKAGLNSMLVGVSEGMVKVLGTKGYTVLANALNRGADIYGAAAMKSAAKMLRGNMITGAASVVILSAGDIANIFRGRISGRQLLKNVANTTATTVGGTVGWIAGSAIPVVGQIAGALIGGALANKAAGTVLDNFVEDDADAMVEIMEAVFVNTAAEYLLTECEVEDTIDYISRNVSGKDLMDMYASGDREYYAKMLFLPYIERKVEHREHIKGITAERLQEGLRLVLENIADSEEYKCSADIEMA